jgi:uncharacterized protein (DUF2236 family)
LVLRAIARSAYDSVVASSSPIVRRINAERLVLASWTRAILLQVAHPLIAAGVADHSGFGASAAASVLRLHHTVRAMLHLTFGSASDQARAIDGIRAIHRRVNGSTRQATGPFPAGTRYSAENPDLVSWVHVTLLDSAVLAYESLVAPLSIEERDAYCRDAAWIAVALGGEEEAIPRTWADLELRFAAVLSSGTLAVGDDARAISRAILHTRLSWVLPLSGWTNARLTGGWLPADLRSQYGLDWSEEHEREFGRLVQRIRRVRHHLPSTIALWRAARQSPPAA